MLRKMSTGRNTLGSDSGYSTERNILTGEVMLTEGSLEELRRNLMKKGDSELDTIASLVELTSLHVPFHISDMTPLCRLVNLRKLILDLRHPVRGLDHVGKLRNLKYLCLCSFGYISFSRLMLESLHLKPVVSFDVTPISELTSLEHLDLQNLPVYDIRFLSNLRELRGLNLTCTRISDLFPLSELQSLSHLYLGRTGVSDLTPLKNLRNLRSVDLHGTKVSRRVTEELLPGLKLNFDSPPIG